ncbi:MAG TPA: helix-hairpin-helix domain-containing protein [Terriglobales bacterium]|nr:helix-hairpin-helix domain-containing protein [Terriglobales bacterium]
MIRNIVRIAAVFCALALFAGIGYAQADNSSQSTSTSAKKNTKKAKTPKSQQVDVNSATKDELAALPGIGDATAQKIIDGRPYKTKRDLLTKKILTQGEYDKVKDQLVAHGGKKSAKKSAMAPK